MTPQSFFHAFGVSHLRELPIAYAVIVLLQGGYLVWAMLGFRKLDRTR